MALVRFGEAERHRNKRGAASTEQQELCQRETRILPGGKVARFGLIKAAKSNPNTNDERAHRHRPGSDDRQLPRSDSGEESTNEDPNGKYTENAPPLRRAPRHSEIARLGLRSHTNVVPGQRWTESRAVEDSNPRNTGSQSTSDRRMHTSHGRSSENPTRRDPRRYVTPQPPPQTLNQVPMRAADEPQPARRGHYRTPVAVPHRVAARTTRRGIRGGSGPRSGA